MYRRAVLGMIAAALPLGRYWRPATTAHAATADLASIREWVRAGIERDASGRVVRIFGLDGGTLGDVLLRATKADALPDGYVPRDMVNPSARGIPSVGAQLVRAVIIDDTRALVEAAKRDGISLYVGSGFRSQAYQVALFAAQVARWGDEETANRYSARPGHSQHQLGTTIDFTTDFRSFRNSGTADWLRENAHQFGFVLPYTPASTPLTGYVDEPWHARWVGQAFASQCQSAGYKEWTDLDVDDVIALVRAEAALDA
jgi:D-alanyl-D-alanine carboxypeptidase